MGLGFFGRISNTFSLMGSSWEVLKANKKLLVLASLSAICCLMVLASFAIPAFSSGVFDDGVNFKTMTSEQRVTWGALAFLFYFANYFIIILFNSAIITCAVAHMKGTPIAVTDGLNMALKRLPQILAWALVAATVSTVLRIIENMNKKVGRFVAGLLGMAWSLMTFLVVPVLVVEGKGPVGAFKESAKMLKKTWGEQIVGNFGFGLVFFLLAIPAIIVIVLGVLSGSVAAMAVAIGCAVLYLILLGLIQSTLQTIFQAAVYLYAKEGAAPIGFDAGQLSGAVVHK